MPDAENDRLRCANCGDAVTREGVELVGSDGETDCPLGLGPHGPAVPDDGREYQYDADGTYYAVSSVIPTEETKP